MIETGKAFCTGHHGTTYGCLLAFDLLARTQHIKNVLNFGYSLGVLATSSAKV
jgi:ribosomal protein L11 methyltransferase